MLGLWANAHLEQSGRKGERLGLRNLQRLPKVSLDSIARTTRHKSLAVLMGYVRPVQTFDDVALTSMIA